MLLLLVLHLVSLALSQLSIADKLLERCWAELDFMKLMDDPTCHLAWLTHLKTAPVIAIDYAAPLGGEHDGSVRLVLGQPGGGVTNVTMHAMFKPCSSSRNNPTRELIAYHIDRALLLHRAPATVLRRFAWSELLSTRPFGAIGDALARIKSSCSSHDPDFVTGVLQGWTKFDMKLLDRVDDDFAKEIWLQRTPSTAQIEFSRLMIALFMNGIESDLFQHVAELDEPEAVSKALLASGHVAERRRLLVGIERGHSSWASSTYEAPPAREQPCQRTHEGASFRCQLHVSEKDSPELLAGRVLTFLRTACLFPKLPAERLQVFASPWSEKLSHVIEEEMRKLGRDITQKPPPAWSPKVLDERVEQLAGMIDACVKIYGTVETLFED
jgi:hypothetical protein